MLKRIIVPLFFCCSATSLLWSQGMAPGGGTAAPAPVQNSNVAVAPGVNFLESQTAQNFSKDIFDVESDSIDFEEGAFTWKGRTFNLGNSRVARARFERYLAIPELEEDEAEYLQVIRKISDLLSLMAESEVKDSETLREQIYEAWQLLFEAGRYEMDGGTSLVIANQVYNIWRARDENYDLNTARKRLEEEKRNIQNFLTSDGWRKEKEFNEIQRKRALKQHTGKMFDGVTEATFQAERMAETQARIAAIDTQAAATGIQAKLQFQTQILNLLLQRRFEHCTIACSFYRYSFKGSHSQMQVGLKELRDFMPISDFSPTVETIEFMAREAKNDINIGMRTVESHFDNKELHAALERMQETFFLGEHMPNVLQFSPEKRRQLLTLYRKTREVQNLADLKDYAKIEEVVHEIREMAYDFPSSRIIAAVSSAQRVSNLALLASQQATVAGDYEKADLALQKATEVWPLNPGIHEFSKDLAFRSDMASRGSVAFDELLKREDFRQIYDRRTEFGAALFQNAEKSEVLKSIIERMGRIDIMLAQAEELDAQDNTFGSWEILLAAKEIDPDDPEIARLQAKLAPRAARFVAALDKAKRAEESGDYAISLNGYLAAQDIYPVSKTSRVGIERVSKLLLRNLRPGE